MDVATATIPTAADPALPLPREDGVGGPPLRLRLLYAPGHPPRPTLPPLTRDLLTVTSAHPRPGWSRLTLLSL
jgi:hypothetical protein